MTETLQDMGPGMEDVIEPVVPEELGFPAAREMVRAARQRGMAVTGPGGLLKALTKSVIEAALEEEMVDHLACRPICTGCVADGRGGVTCLFGVRR